MKEYDRGILNSLNENFVLPLLIWFRHIPLMAVISYEEVFLKIVGILQLHMLFVCLCIISCTCFI